MTAKRLAANPTNLSQHYQSTTVSKALWFALSVTQAFMYGSYAILVNLSNKHAIYDDNRTLAQSRYYYNNFEGLEATNVPPEPAVICLLIELGKLMISVFILLVIEPRQRRTDRDCQHKNPHASQKHENDDEGSTGKLYRLFYDSVPLLVIAVLYTFTNNTAIYIQDYVDPSTYQVLSQFKVITTACFYNLILSIHLVIRQWIAIAILSFACAMYGIDSMLNQQVRKSASKTASRHNDAQVTGVTSGVFITWQGIALLLVYCTISGLASALCERAYKRHNRRSINQMNAMLYLYGILLNAVVFVLSGDINWVGWNSIGTFRGFSTATWMIILMQSISGLLMSLIMKYKGNITRLFIIAGSLGFNAALSTLILGIRLPRCFFISVLLIVYSYNLFYNKHQTNSRLVHTVTSSSATGV